MPKEIHVEGYKQFKETLQNVHVDKNDTFVLFSGTKDAQGKSWCPDCVTGVYYLWPRGVWVSQTENVLII